MFGNRRPRHFEALAEFAERLAGALVQTIEQFAPALVGQSPENEIAIVI
jgi:hypothetical protein